MANTKISALTAASTPLAGTEVLAGVQSSTTKKITAQSIADLSPQGTVTSTSVITANGVSGTVATATTTPAITLTLGDITPTSVATSGTVTGSNISGSSSGTNTGDQNIFQTVAISGQSNVVADTTTDTLTLAADTGVVLTTNATTDTVTIGLDSDLATIAGLTATTDNFLQAKSSAWASRTVAQVTTDLQSTGLVDAVVGFRNIPQVSQSAAYTTVASDSGKHILHPSGDANARTFTIDSNANVAYPVGTAITFVNETSQVLSIAITSDTLTLAGSTTTGTRSLAQNGVATALKVTSTKWIISGTGLT